MIKKTAPSPSKARKQVKKATKISGLPKPSSNATKTKAGLKKKIEKREAAGKKATGAKAELKSRNSNRSKTTSELKKKIERRTAAGKKTAGAKLTSSPAGK